MRLTEEPAAGLVGFEIDAPLPVDWPIVADLVERYADFSLGTVDASIAVLADRLGTDLVVTLDRRHFRAIRSPGGRLFRLMPEPPAVHEAPLHTERRPLEGGRAQPTRNGGRGGSILRRRFSAAVGRAQVLGGQTESGAGEVLKRDAARNRADGSIRAEPIEDEHPRQPARINGGYHSRPRLVRGQEPAKDLVRWDEPQ